MRALFIALLIPLAAGYSVENPEEEIRQRLEQWPKDFNSKRIKETCALFAPDLVASYPNTQDKNYAEMCRHLTAAMTDIHKQYSYEQPKIEQIILSGDLAAVRLVWTLHVHSNQQEIEKVTEKGLDIFKRQPDGSWKIAISYAFPL